MVSKCANPDADADGDGITNADEVREGLSPVRRDTDRDGVDDDREPIDCDGDGRRDAAESSKQDIDADGVPDPWDPDDRQPECAPRLVPTAGVPDGEGCIAYTCEPRPVCEPECLRGEECVAGEDGEARCITPVEATEGEGEGEDEGPE